MLKNVIKLILLHTLNEENANRLSIIAWGRLLNFFHKEKQIGHSVSSKINGGVIGMCKNLLNDSQLKCVMCIMCINTGVQQQHLCAHNMVMDTKGELM